MAAPVSDRRGPNLRGGTRIVATNPTPRRPKSDCPATAKNLLVAVAFFVEIARKWGASTKMKVPSKREPSSRKSHELLGGERVNSNARRFGSAQYYRVLRRKNHLQRKMGGRLSLKRSPR